MPINAKALMLLWPWFFGTHVAVQCGADNPSLVRTVAGAVFEAPWVAAFVAVLNLGRQPAGKPESSAVGWPK
jgi:hypothetical protein